MKLTVLIALVAVAGCASGRRPPVDSAAHQLHRSVNQANEATTPRGPVAVDVRFNPAEECECPEFELFAYGAWTRVYIDGGVDMLNGLRSADPLTHSNVRLRRDGERLAPNGVSYAVWSVE